MGFTSHHDGDDPWGGGGGSGSFARPALPVNERDEQWGATSVSVPLPREGGMEEPDEHEDDGWGGVRQPYQQHQRDASHDEDWEKAQELMRLKQDRAVCRSHHSLHSC